jgi:hypothetical protein
VEPILTPAAPSAGALDVLRAITRAGFAYSAAKSLCDVAGWRLLDDEPDLGYVRYDMPLEAGSDQWRVVSVLVAETTASPGAFAQLFWYEEYDAARGPFDAAFHTIAAQVAALLGPASRSGEYRYPHSPDWPYLFAGWRLSDAVLVLVQDESDIQFGMDITLWVKPAGAATEPPIHAGERRSPGV